MNRCSVWHKVSLATFKNWDCSSNRYQICWFASIWKYVAKRFNPCSLISSDPTIREMSAEIEEKCSIKYSTLGSEADPRNKESPLHARAMLSSFCSKEFAI